MELNLQSKLWQIWDFIRLVFDLPFYIWVVISESFCSLVANIRPRTRKSLDNDILLITGVAAGIGREAVIQLATHSTNATFVLWDINETGLHETAEECRKLGVNVYSYVVDLSRQEDVIQTAAKVRQQVGNVTILINNAGLIQFHSFLQADPAVERKVLEVNLFSYLWTIREFLPGMIERGKGHIVSTCSGLAYMRFRCLSSYVASKHGLNGFLDCLKLEMSLHPDKPDIKFSTIYPAWVKTAMATPVTWKPRYKSWKILQPMECDYVAREMVDGILKEKENIMIPQGINFMKFFYGISLSGVVDRIENFVYKDIKIQSSSTNLTSGMSQPRPVTKTNNNMTSCNENISLSVP